MNAPVLNMFNNPILHSMANIIRDYDDIREDRRQRRRPRISFRPELEDDADVEANAPKTEIMRLWKAKRWKELREALGAKAMIAGAAMVQIGHDPKTAKQKQKEKETAISTERHKARAEVAKCIRKRLSSMLYDFARTFAEMDGLDCPTEDEYDHDKDHHTLLRYMTPDVVKFTLDDTGPWRWPMEHIKGFFSRNYDKFPPRLDRDLHRRLGLSNEPLPWVSVIKLLCDDICSFNECCQVGADRIAFATKQNTPNTPRTIFEERQRDEAIRRFIAKHRRGEIANPAPVRNQHDVGLPKHHVDLIYDCIERATIARYDCWKLAHDFVENDFARGAAGREGGPCHVSAKDLYYVLGSCRDVPADIIHAMISVAPQHALKYRDFSSKRNLLHVAACSRRDPVKSDSDRIGAFIKHRLQIDIIKRLIDLRPVLLNEEDVNGLTPLARLILFDKSGHNPDKKDHARGDFATLVKMMCEGGTKTCAGKARSKDAKELPLHLAASCQVHPSVLADIIEAFPEGIDKPCRNGYNAVFHCLSTMDPRPSKNAIQNLHTLIKAKPELARTGRVLTGVPGGPPIPPEAGRTPLQFCIEHGLDDGVVAALLDADKDCAKDKNSQGNLPLHQALRVVAHDVREIGRVRKILRAYPGAIEQPGQFGWLPLHFALASNCHAETVRLVLRAHPDAARKLVIDADGGTGGMQLNDPSEAITALHLAVERGDAGLVKDIVAAAPAMATHLNAEVGLPLHHAVHCKAPLPVIKETVAAFPEGTRVANADGRIPLHLAAGGSSGSSAYATLKFLVESYPDSVHVLDHNGKSAADLLGNSEAARLLIQGISEWQAERAARRAEQTANRMADVAARADAHRGAPAAPNAANPNAAPANPIQPGGMDTISLLSRVHQGSAADLQPHELDRLVDGLRMALGDAKYEQTRRPLEDDIVDDKEDWMCPIGHCLLRDPVKASDGFTYERRKIARWMRKSRNESGGDGSQRGGRREAKWKSPMTGAYFKDFTVEPNDEMRTSIEAEVKRRVDDARRNARATDDSDPDSDAEEDVAADSVVAGVTVPRKGKTKRGASGGAKQTPAKRTRRLNVNAAVGETPRRLR